MPTSLAEGTRNAMVSAVAAQVDAGGSGMIEVYSGTQPETPESLPTGQFLCTFTLNNPAYTGPTMAGTMTLVTDPAIVGNPVDTGTAGWFRLFDANGNPILDGSCGVGGSQLNLTTTEMEVGAPVTIASGSLQQSAG